ncbi:photosystem II assembly protein Psb35 [Spirulina subsalsa]|uniref:photosystem II assembly protein Psb35 n=1 Tax=Spirulina subsalsa TaxID=54311 RepID=UPI000307FC92|nr:hypothetical protein [Spirulina subsalsa]
MHTPLDILAAANALPFSFTTVYVVGFIAAVVFGSLAWYNSKRPPGWEDKERPDFIPDLKQDDKKDE